MQQLNGGMMALRPPNYVTWWNNTVRWVIDGNFSFYNADCEVVVWKIIFLKDVMRILNEIFLKNWIAILKLPHIKSDYKSNLPPKIFQKNGTKTVFKLKCDYNLKSKTFRKQPQSSPKLVRQWVDEGIHTMLWQ